MHLNRLVLLLLVAGLTSTPLLAQSGTGTGTGSGKIAPTSTGSSGNNAGMDQGGSFGFGASQTEGDMGGVDPTTRPGSGSGGPNPYPNAAVDSSTINGGSVTGTGALNSAHH